MPSKGFDKFNSKKQTNKETNKKTFVFTLCCILTELAFTTHTQTHTHVYRHTHTHMESLHGRPPLLTELVNHVHNININGETFITSSIGLTQHLFNCAQGALSHMGRGAEEVRGLILNRLINLQYQFRFMPNGMLYEGRLYTYKPWAIWH